jgi:DNA-binding MarR family transcriptional regulator
MSLGPSESASPAWARRRQGRRLGLGATGGASAGSAKDPGLTLQAARIIQVLFSDLARDRYTTDLAELTGMPPATARWVLTRLAETGWVQGTIRQADRRGITRDRRVYALTPAGRAAAPAALAAARRQLEAIDRDLTPPGPGQAAGNSAAVHDAPDVTRTGPGPELTLQEARVVQVFAGDPSQARYITALAGLAGMPASTVRKILIRLASVGWLSAAAEDPGARNGRRGAARLLYTLTPAGRAAAPAALAAARRQLEAINREFRSAGPEAGPG